MGKEGRGSAHAWMAPPPLTCASGQHSAAMTLCFLEVLAWITPHARHGILTFLPTCASGQHSAAMTSFFISASITTLPGSFFSRKPCIQYEGGHGRLLHVLACIFATSAIRHVVSGTLAAAKPSLSNTDANCSMTHG